MRRTGPAAKVLCALSTLLLFAAPGSGRQPQQSQTPPPGQQPQTPAPNDLTLAANLVTLTVVVRDAAGKLVPDLPAGDFEVYEDGKRRDLDRFSSQGEVPLRLVLLFDTSISVRDRIDFEKRAAARFFSRALRPGDRAALFAFSTKLHKVETLTESTDALSRAVDTLKIEGITAFNAAVDGTARYLDKAPGRRVIVLLSDGHDTVRPERFGQALASVQSAGATVYAISPAGSDETPVGRLGATTLRKLAAATGGTAFFPPVRANRELEAADLDEIFGRVVDELRAHYVLTYYSDTAREDGKFHTIRVDVKRPGLVASYRSGFYADGAGPPPPEDGDEPEK